MIPSFGELKGLAKRTTRARRQHDDPIGSCDSQRRQTARHQEAGGLPADSLIFAVIAEVCFGA